MLAEQLVREDVGRHRAILMQRADARGGDAGAGIDQRQIGWRGEIDRLVQRRMGRHAAPERAKLAVLLAHSFAGQLEFDDLQLLVGRGQVGERDPEAADHAVDGRDAGVDLDQCPHLDRPAAVRGKRRIALFDQRDRLRGRNRDDPADPGAGEIANIAAVHDVLFSVMSRMPAR